MKHNIAKFLEDIRLSIQNIENYSAGITTSGEIEDNQMLFDALCRRFAIIGEAVFQIDKHDPGIIITDKNKIKSLRHIIIHDYDLVRAADLLIIINKKLPVLKEEYLPC